MMSDKMDAASEERNTKLEMLELNGCVSIEVEGSKGLLVANGDRGSSSNELDVNDNGVVISPGIRDEGIAVFDGRSGLPIEEMSDNMLMEPEAGDSLLVLHVLQGSSDALIAPVGGNHLGVLPEAADGFASASLGRDDVMIEPEASNDLMDLPEVNDSLDVASELSNQFIVLPEDSDCSSLAWEISNHSLDLPEVKDGLAVSSEHGDHLLFQPEVNKGLDVAFKQGDHLIVLPEVSDGLNDASEHSDHLIVLSDVTDGLDVASELSNHLKVLPEVNNGLDVASEHSNHLIVLPDATVGLNDASELSDHLMVLPEVKDGLAVASEHGDHLIVGPEVNDGLDVASEHSDHLIVPPEVTDGLNDSSAIRDDLPIIPGVRDGLISASGGSADETIAPEVSNNLTMSPEGNDDTTKVRNGITSALGTKEEGLIASEGGLDSLNTDDTSIDHSRAVADSELDPSDIQECNVCGFCDLSFQSEVELVKHQKTHFMNTESETSINASPCEDRPSRTCTEEQQFKCSICREVFSDPNKLSAHKFIHSLNVSICEVCDKAFRTIEDLQHHRQMHSTERRFSCDVCSEAFTTSSSLLNHQTIRHPCNSQESSRKVNQVTRYVCGHCKEAFLCEEDLLEHEAVHVDKKPLICSRCGKVLTSVRSLRWHLAIHKNKSYPCARCGTSLKSYYHLNRHKQVHKDRPFSCDICRKIFKTQEAFRNHSRHHEEESLICDKCNKKLKTRVELHRHKRSHKTVEKRHDCDVCNKSYKRAAHLKKHKLSHKGTPKRKLHSCRFCQKSYSKVSQLSLHLQTHDKVKPGTSSGRSNRYCCGICSSSFETFYSMKKHKQMHKERPYMCDVCEETFTVGAALRRHKLRKCSNGYACEVCNKSFSTTHQLRSHSLKHISLKPYMCSFCHKCFKTTKQLRNHMLLHTGSKPHICQVCSKRFAEVEQLTRHKKICSIGLKFSMLTKTSKQALDPPGIKRAEEPLPESFPCAADLSGSEVSSRMDGNANKGNISGGEDYQNKTSDKQPVSVNVGLTGVDGANSGEGRAMLVEMSCDEIPDCQQKVSADGKSSQASDTSNDAKSSPKEDGLISGKENKKLQVRLEKFVLYICDVCDKSFASQDLLDEHMVKHIKEVPQRDQQPQKSVQNPDQQQKQESPKAFLVKAEQPIKPIKQEAHALFKCEECFRAFPHEYGLQLHKKWVHSKKEERHPCKSCGKTYKHSFHLTEHLKLSKSCNLASAGAQITIKMLRCDICGEKFSLIEKYKDHVIVHLNERPVKCETCGTRYKYKAGLEYHKAFLCNRAIDPSSASKEYVQPKRLNCEVCHKHFADMPRFKDHFRSHSDARPFSCKTCGKSYKYARDVSTHELKTCSRKKTGQAKGKVMRRGNLQNNKQGGLKQKVASPPKWKCKTCGKDFLSHELHQLHKFTCAVREKNCWPYKCDICGKEFNHKIDIQKHDCNSNPLVIKNVTLDCEVCGKGFKRFISQGTEHVNKKCISCKSLRTDVSKEPTGKQRTTKPTETIPGPSDTNNGTAKDSEEAQSKSVMIQKFPCKICNHVFAYKTQLKKHEQNHVEERPFKCNKCNKDFTRLRSLQLHKRKSHGSSDTRYMYQKKCKCRFCNKFFRFPYERERHETTHYSEKRYKCECGEAFKQKYQLTRHRRLEKHPIVQPGPETVKNSKSPQAAQKPQSSGKPAETRKDSEQNILVDNIDFLQAQPQKPDPMCSDKNDKGSFRCNKCDKKFSRKKFHKLHQQKCTTLKCRFCSVFFNNLASLETHEKSHTGHGDTKLHKCHCGKSYMNKTSLRRHQTKHHPTKKSSQLDLNRVEHSETSAPSAGAISDQQQSPTVPFKCQKCNKVFNRYGLQRHEKTKKWRNGCIEVVKDKPRGQEEGRHLETAIQQPEPSQQPQRVQEAVEKNVIRIPSGKNLVILKDNQKTQQNNASRYGVTMVQQPGTPQNVLLNAEHTFKRLSLESFKKYQQFSGSTSFQQSAHSPDNLIQHEKTHIQEVHRCDCGQLFKQKHELESHQITGHHVNSSARQQNSIGLAEGATQTRKKNFITQRPPLRENDFGMSGSQTNREAFAENGPTPRVVNEIFKCKVCAHVWCMKWTPENDYRKDKQERACPNCRSVFSYEFHVKVSKKNVPQTKSTFKPTDESHQSQRSVEDLPSLRSRDAFRVPSYKTSPVDDVCSLPRGELRQTRQFAHSENGEELAEQELTIEGNSCIDLPEFTDLPGGSRDFQEDSQVSTTRSNLVDLQEVPGPERIRACKFCGKFFMKTYILEHEQSHSNDVLVHLNTNDADEESLNEDRVIQGLRRSDACNTNMERADSTKMKQSQYKPYHCERCGQRFDKIYNLKMHATYVCNALEQEATIEETKESTEEEPSLLKCGICSTFFNSMPLLVDHMKGHN